MKENSEITKQDRKGCSKGVSLLFYFVSLCLAVPMFTLLSFAIITILTKNQDSPLIYLMLVVLLALYTRGFFFMARRSFGFGPGRLATNHGRYKDVVTAGGVKDVAVKEDIVQERKLERSQDRTKGLTFVILWLVIGGLVVLPRLVGGFGWLVKRMGWSNNGDDRLTFFFTIITMVIILVSYSFYARRRLYVKRMDRSLLWLRRFHQDGMFPFDLVLDDICRGIALPLTVADTTVSKSELAGQLHPVYNIGMLTLGLAFMGGFAAWAFFPLSKIALVSIPL
jgi:hypothetical protein